MPKTIKANITELPTMFIVFKQSVGQVNFRRYFSLRPTFGLRPKSKQNFSYQQRLWVEYLSL